MLRHPLRPQSVSDPGPFLNMSEDEYRQILLAWGYSERAADQELAQRQAYLEKLRPPKLPEPTTEEMLTGNDPITQAVLRRRLGTVKPTRDPIIEERPPTHDSTERAVGP